MAKEIKEGTRESCWTCNGSGNCTHCKGTGKLGTKTCHFCNGSGNCDSCEGTGEEYTKPDDPDDGEE